MKAILTLVFAGLLLVAVGSTSAQTGQGTTGTQDSTMGTSDVKADECTQAKVRIQLMDNGIQTKSTTGTAATTSRTPASDEVITVDVDNGIVTLTGVVGSSTEQDRIVSIVKGVNEVKSVVPNLQVRGKTGNLNSTGTNTNSEMSDTTEMSGDAAVTSAVRSKLNTDGKLMPGIQIETDNGDVTLTGTVDSQGEAERLVLLARSVPNVKSVTSNLKIRNSQ